MSSNPHDAFSVEFKDKTFIMSRSQVEFEPDSLFAKCFLGDFKEGEEKRMMVDRNPATFKVILDHLMGYSVLPLAEYEWQDARLSEAKMLRYLKADAEYYGLDILSKETTKALDQLNATIASNIAELGRVLEQTKHLEKTVSHSDASQYLLNHLLDKLGQKPQTNSYSEYNDRLRAWETIRKLVSSGALGSGQEALHAAIDAAERLAPT